MGAMQLFAACQKAPSVRRVILKSTSEVYGSHPHDPVFYTEDSSSRRPLAEGFARDSIDIEGYARGLGRRRPDIAVTILRLANMIGPAMDTALSRYLAGPLVPTVLGHDARLQLLHEQDALGALERATMAGKSGTFNIGADGIIMMSQAIRRSGRIGASRTEFRGLGTGFVAKSNQEFRTQSRPDAMAELRPGDGYDADANGVGIRSKMDHDRGIRRLRARPWFDSDHRPEVGTLDRKSRRRRRATLGWLRSSCWGEGTEVAGESKAKVIPLHSNSSRAAAARRATQRAEAARRHPSLASEHRLIRLGRGHRRRRPGDRRAPRSSQHGTRRGRSRTNSPNAFPRSPISSANG